MIYFRAALVAGTALFVSYHTTIFIQSIEPSPVLAWILALLVEGFLISLALMKTVISRVLIVPLFLVSVTAASLSFVVQNEQLLQDFINRGKVVSQIQEDLQRTERAYQFGERYITRTLQRERMLQDQLRELLSQGTGEVALAKAVIFFVVIMVIQAVSLYTAISLKNMTTDTAETSVLELTETADTATETPVSEHVSDVSELVKKTGLSRSTVYRYLRGQKVSPDAMQKIQQALR